jgi:hypothetical protein
LRVQRDSFENLLDSLEARETFEWPKISHCQIVPDSISREKVITVRHQKWQAIRPLDDSDFFLSFARLGSRGEPKERKIVEWVSKYGLPRRERKDTWGSGPEQDHMLVASFREEVRRASELLNFYTDVRGRNLTAIKSRMADPRSDLDRHLAEVRGSAYYLHLERAVEHTILRRDEPDLLVAWRVFSGAMARQLEGIRLRLDVVSPQRAAQSYHCNDLLSAMYLQFYLLVVEQKPMRYCAHPKCGMPFPLTNKKKLFCNQTCRSGARHYS